MFNMFKLNMNSGPEWHWEEGVFQGSLLEISYTRSFSILGGILKIVYSTLFLLKMRKPGLQGYMLSPEVK